MTNRPSRAAALRGLLAKPELAVMPCCFDALSAKLIEQAGFPVTFMSGFAVSAARLGLPDTGLISYGEIVDTGRNICAATSIPVIGDGDTGYGNAVNVKRTVKGYAQAGFASVMIEDQVWPKRCGHTRGKAVVERGEAVARIQAAADARDELREAGGDILILARSDARATDGLDEGLRRMEAFAAAGADILFLEAPKSEEEMRAFCSATDRPALANMVEQGETPVLPPKVLEEIGYSLAAYPLTLLAAAMKAMQDALAAFKAGEHPKDLLDWDSLRDVVGFNAYYAEEERYRG
ncbi:isocitrate lyase/PEP mutase family protein [Pelagibius marinus]|uniref:isocitrate lyase/PEP mutase family protein n=1 Tax=Pelagibius marinus TaxID=2762760 RepID=UPI001872C78B|nr:isocitrate lyase/PEP mutase family protein [Pelagibius marinus]